MTAYVDKEYLKGFWDEKVKEAPKNVKYNVQNSTTEGANNGKSWDKMTAPAADATTEVKTAYEKEKATSLNSGFTDKVENKTVIGAINELSFITDDEGWTTTKAVGNLGSGVKLTKGMTIQEILNQILCAKFAPKSLAAAFVETQYELGVAATTKIKATWTAGSSASKATITRPATDVFTKAKESDPDRVDSGSGSNSYTFDVNIDGKTTTDSWSISLANSELSSPLTKDDIKPTYKVKVKSFMTTTNNLTTDQLKTAIANATALDFFPSTTLTINARPQNAGEKYIWVAYSTNDGKLNKLSDKAPYTSGYNGCHLGNGGMDLQVGHGEPITVTGVTCGNTTTDYYAYCITNANSGGMDFAIYHNA